MLTYFQLLRNWKKADEEYIQWLEICTPFKAKKHLNKLDDIFATLNKHLPVEQRVRISLKVPIR